MFSLLRMNQMVKQRRRHENIKIRSHDRCRLPSDYVISLRYSRLTFSLLLTILVIANGVVLVLAEPPLPDSLLHGAARQGSHRQRLMANGLVTNIEGRYLPCAPLHFKRQGRPFVHVNRASRNMTTPIVSPNMTSPILKDTG